MHYFTNPLFHLVILLVIAFLPLGFNTTLDAKDHHGHRSYHSRYNHGHWNRGWNNRGWDRSYWNTRPYYNSYFYAYPTTPYSPYYSPYYPNYSPYYQNLYDYYYFY